jgi:ribonucleoside-diphosphate reductase alpha chain
MADQDHTFSCVLSSMNASKYDEWKDTDAVFTATVFLDCVNQDLIEIGKNIKGLEKVVRFAEKSRALGLGMLGFHTYLQDHMIPFESLEAHLVNIEIFKHLDEESKRATEWMAYQFGEPEWCVGYGMRNTHRLAVAPNLSSALICGSVSQGIEPIYKNAYIQNTAAGKINRVNPSLLKIMKERKVYNDAVIKDIIAHNGSVQYVDWLDDHEKQVFKTAFEIDQKTIIKLASVRQPYIDQAQSINLFFSADESEEYISEVHKMAFLDKNIKSLYYIRSETGVQTSKGECTSCHG